MSQEIQRQTAAALAAIWARSRDTILGRLDVLDEAALALLEGRLDGELRRRAESEAHKLAGSLGTFGMPEGSRIAILLEERLQGDGRLVPGDALSVSEWLLALRRVLERGPALPGAPEPARPADAAVEETGPTLLVVSSDQELADRLAAQAAQRALPAVTAATPHAAQHFRTVRTPSALVLDLSPTEWREANLALLAVLLARTPSMPAVVLTADDDFALRREVTRLGARLCLPKPVDPAEVLDMVEGALQERPTQQTRVLAVDDDPLILELLPTLLEPHGLSVIPLADPFRFWETLTATSPDLVLLDLNLPQVSGIELCRMLRSSPRWAGVPVLFLTSVRDPDTVQKVFASGADDFVLKPVIGPELVARILSRIERTRLYRDLAATDAQTGTESRRSATERLGRYLRLAERHRQPVSLALVELGGGDADGDGEVHASAMLETGRRLLRKFRGDDVVARWGERCFLVGSYGVRRPDLGRRMGTVLERVATSSAHPVTFQVGLAEYPQGGSELDRLLQAAAAELDGGGRPRAEPEPAAEPDDGAARADVVLVDDDEAIAGLLLHALTAAGYSVRWLQDGPAAVESLGGERPELRARIVLLDVGLPGLDGISVLRELARQGVTRGTRVIMLTRRSTEPEVVQALELGAADHIAKPFSVPVLMRKLRLALGE